MYTLYIYAWLDALPYIEWDISIFDDIDSLEDEENQ